MFVEVASSKLEKAQSLTEGGADKNRKSTPGGFRRNQVGGPDTGHITHLCPVASGPESRGERKADFGARSTCEAYRIVDARRRALLGWLAVRTEIFFTDGLRYIAQARTIDRGSLAKGFVHSVDHPIYPIAIVAAHRLIGGDRPRDWQTAAQVAALCSGVLLVIPLYLISLELFGASRAWVACLFIYLVPFNGHVLADALSESTFLLFWACGLWSSLKLLRTAKLGWLLPVVIASALAYLTRPEGLVILLSLVATLIVLPFWRSLDYPAAQCRWALGLLLLGGIVAAGPFMFAKGGISSKPSMSRLLGSAPRADAMAVERERPLEGGQPLAKTVFVAARALGRAVVAGDADPPALARSAGDSGFLLDGCWSKIVAAARDHARLVRTGAHPRAHDGRLLHAPARHGPGLDLDPCGGRRARASDGDPGSCRGKVQGRTMGCPQNRGCLDGGCTDRLYPGFSASFDRSDRFRVCRLSRSRRMVGREDVAWGESHRPQGPGPLLRGRDGIYLRQAH